MKVKKIWKIRGHKEGRIVKIKNLKYKKMVNYLEETYLDHNQNDDPNDENPCSFILVTSVGLSSNSRRMKEFRIALELNNKNKHIKEMIIFLDKSNPKLQEFNPFIEFMKTLEKVVLVDINGRLNFMDALSYTYENYFDETIVLCNCDIFITDTINKIKNMDLNNWVLCLTRYDIIDETTFEIRNRQNQIFDTSQDTWIYKANRKFNHDKPIYMGEWNCDNEFNRMFYRNGSKLLNPCREIMTIHLHNENSRNYSQDQQIPFVHPVGLGYLCEID